MAHEETQHLDYLRIPEQSRPKGPVRLNFIFYFLSIIFFFSGTLSICLLCNVRSSQFPGYMTKMRPWHLRMDVEAVMMDGIGMGCNARSGWGARLAAS